MSGAKESKQLITRMLPYAIIILAGIFYVYEFFLRVMPSAMTHELMSSFDIEASGLGVISSLFFYGYAPMQIPAGLLIDRYSVRLLLTISVLFCSLGALIIGVTDHYAIAGFGRFLIGFTSAFSFVGTLVLASRWFAAKHFALITGLVQFMGSFGAIAGAAPVAVLVQLYGWRPTQIWSAVVGIILAILFWLIIRDNPEKSINTSKHTLINHNLTEKQRLKVVLHNKQTWSVALYAFSIWAPMTIFSVLWGIPFLKTLYNIDTASAASGIAVIWLGVAFVGPILGWWSNRINNRRIPLIVSSLAAILSSVALIYMTLPAPILYTVLFIFGGAASAHAVTFGLVQDNHPPTVAGTAVGFNNMAVIASGVVLQPLAGFILDACWTGEMLADVRFYPISAYKMALSTIPMCGVLGLIASIFFIKETHCAAVWEIKSENT